MNGFSYSTMTVDEHRLPLLRKYSELLLSTCEICQSICQETTSSVPILFASKILALASFRLPSIGNIIYSAMNNLFPPSSISTPDLRHDIYVPSSASSPLSMSSIAKSHSMTTFPPSHSVLSFHEEDFYQQLSDDDLSRSEDDPEMIIDFAQDMIIPSSASPTPSPAFQTKGNSFSPIPEADLTDEEPDVDVLSMQLKLNTPTSLRVKDYTINVDRAVRRSLRRYSPEQHDQMVTKLPTLFYWDRVVHYEGVSSKMEGKEWWTDRLQVCDGLLFDLIRSWFDLIDEALQSANARRSCATN